MATTDLSEDAHVAVLGATAGAGISAAFSTISQNMHVQDQVKMNYAVGAASISCGVSGAGLVNVGIDVCRGHAINIKQTAMLGLGAGVGLLAAEGTGLYMHNKMESFLEETTEERDLRLGFEKIPLLKNDEK